MKPAPFAYARPARLEEALAILAAAGDDYAVLAGGQSLVPLLNLRLSRPRLVVDVNRVAGLDRVRPDEGWLRLGAMVRQRRLEKDPAVRRALPLLVEALGHVAHPEIRARSTVGGSLVHLDPAAELPAVAALLDAELELRSAGAVRRLRFDAFALGAFTPALQPGELLTEVALPLPSPGASWAVEEVAPRPGDFAVAGALALLDRPPVGAEQFRLVVFGASPTPVRARRLEELAAAGENPLDHLATLDEELEPADDRMASAVLRRDLARVAARRCLLRCGAAGGARV